MKSAFLQSTIGRKVVMAVMAVGLMIFLLAHLAGNFLLYIGRDAFNLYAHKLISNPFIYVLEVLLVLGFGLHTYEGIRLTLISRRARRRAYSKRQTLGKRTWFSSHMFLTGSVIFIFLVIHIKSFKYGEYIPITVEGQTIRDLYTVVVQHFQKPWYALLYVVAILLLTFHLLHGSISLPKTLGIYSETNGKWFRWIGIVMSLFIGLGFISMPIYFLFFGG